MARKPDWVAIAEQAGLVVIDQSWGKHQKLRVQAPDGRQQMIVVAKTPTDRTRGALNTRALMRRFAKGD